MTTRFDTYVSTATMGLDAGLDNVGEHHSGDCSLDGASEAALYPRNGPACGHATSASIESSMRPNCLNREKCGAKTPGKHCRSCAARLVSTPDVIAKRAAKLREHYRDPSTRAKASATAKARHAKLMQDPAFVERLREGGRKLFHTHATKPDVRTRAGRTRSDRALAHIPPAYRPLYREIRPKIGADAARELVMAQAADDTRRAVERVREAQIKRHEREKAQAY